MRRYHIITLIILLAVVILAAVKIGLPSFLHFTPEEPGQVDPGTEPDIQTISLTAVGGIYPHRPMLAENRLEDGEYDFWPCFEFIAPYFQSADIAMVVLETVQAGPEIELWGVSGYTGHEERSILTFNAPIQLSHALKRAGLNLYSFANNHCMDRGLEGLQATLRNVRELGFYTTGAYLSREERDAPDIVEINGIKVAFIAYTYGTNGIPILEGHEYSVNLTPSFEDSNSIIADIKSARAAGADLVAVIPHWGEQYIDYPFEWQREIARELAEAGADMILGGHPKMVQPIEWVYPHEGCSTHPTLVVYSLGNFYTDQHYSPPYITTDLVEYGLLLNLELAKDMDSGKAWVSNVNYDIHWCHRDWRHRMLVLSEVFEEGPEKFNLTQSQLERLKVKYRENVEIIERYGFSEKKPAYMKR